MNERERNEFISNFDIVSILDNLEENNRLVVNFLIKDNSLDLPLEVFDVLYSEILFLKKACEKNKNWSNLIEIYIKNIDSVRNNERNFYYLLNGEIKKISLNEKVKKFLEKESSLCLTENLENL